MDENRENIILGVELDAAKVAQELQDVSRQIANVKRNQQDLDAQLKSGEISLSQYTKQTAQLKDEQSWLQKEQKGLIATQKLLTAETDTYSDSLNGERQRLADMQKAYDQLDKSLRESEGGKRFLEQIKEQSDKVKGLEEETGRAQRNVGNYPKVFQPAEKALSKFGLSLQDFQEKGSKAFLNVGQSIKSFGKLLITPPIALIVGILSAILIIVQKVSAAFKKNDDAMTALQKAFAVFKPIGEAISILFDKIASGLAKIAEGAAKAVSWIADKLAPGYKKAADEAQSLVKSQDDLQEAERQYTENSAKRLRDIAELRAKAAEKDKYTAEERKKYLTDAIGLEKQNLEDQKNIAAEKLRIIEQTAKQERDTSDETKDKIAQARAAMYQAEQAYYAGVRKLNKEVSSIERESAAERKRETEERLREERAAAAARLEIKRKTEDQLLTLETDATRQQIEQARRAGEREIENLKIKLDNLKKEDMKGRAALQELIEATEKATQKRITDIAIKANEEREHLILETKRKAAEIGINDAVVLAQMQADAMREDYEHLQNMTDEQVMSLYGSWDAYYSALTSAENAAFDARENLLNEQYNRRQQQIQNEYNQRLIGIDNEYALAELEYAQKQEEYDTLVNMDAETKARLYTSEEEYTAAVIAAQDSIAKAAQNTIKVRLKSFGELGNAFNSMSTALGDFAEQSSSAAAAQKAFALSGILFNQAQSISEGALAIAKGVESASALPFPSNIPAILSVVGTITSLMAGVLTSISQAKSLFSQAEGATKDAGKFSQGGTIGGNSYTGDKLIAHVNSGEGIYTGTQANNLLQEVANNPARGGFDYGQMADAFAEAVATLPAPIMDYREFTTFENNVATYNEIAKI